MVWKIISQILVGGLIVIAGTVAGKKYAAKDWPLITAYWVVLTVKNLVDLIGGILP